MAVVSEVAVADGAMAAEEIALVVVIVAGALEAPLGRRMEATEAPLVTIRAGVETTCLNGRKRILLVSCGSLRVI